MERQDAEPKVTRVPGVRARERGGNEVSSWSICRARRRSVPAIAVTIVSAVFAAVLSVPLGVGVVSPSASAAAAPCAPPAVAVQAPGPAVSVSGFLGKSPASWASGSFNPAAGSVVVATVFARDSYAPAGWASESLTDSLSTHLSWKLAKFEGDTSSMGAVGVWWAYAATALGAMTVTASLAVGGGQYIDSIGVAVKIFTGASPAAPIGAVASGDYAGQDLSVALTPSAAGSALLLAATDGKYTGQPAAGSGDYAADAMDSNNTAAAQEWAGTAAGPALTTSTAAQGLSMTGGSASAQFDYVAFEVVPGPAQQCAPAPAVAVQAPGPAVSVSGFLGKSPASWASGSFNPAAGSVVVATVFARDSYAPAGWASESLTDSLSTHLSWKLAKFEGDTSSMGAVGVWWAYAATALGAMTVTASLAVGGGQYIDSIGVAVKIFTGASPAAPIGAVASGDYAGQDLSVALTPSAAGSALLLAATDGKYTGQPAAGSGDYAADAMDSNNTAAAQEWAGTAAGPALTTSTAAQGLSMTGGSASAQFDYVAFEVVPNTAAATTTGAASTTTTTTAASTTTTTKATTTTTDPPTTADPPPTGSYPTQGTPVCGTATLQSPYNAGNDPALGTTTSVVTVATGNDSALTFNKANTTYYFAPGATTWALASTTRSRWAPTTGTSASTAAGRGPPSRASTTTSTPSRRRRATAGDGSST